MCDGAGDTTGRSGDAIDALAAAVQRVRARGPAASQAALQDELIRLRRAADLLELAFAATASAFDARYDENWGGYPTAINWIRAECRMSSAAAVKAVCVGEEAAAIPLSIAALEQGRLGFAHLSLLAATAKGVRETPNPAGVEVAPFDERPLLKQALAHPLKRFRDDCAHVRHAHSAALFLAAQNDDEVYRTLEVRTGEEGALFLHGCLDAVGGATLRTALDPLARWRGGGDLRTREQRYADALVELATHCLDAGAVPSVGGQRPHLQVTSTVATLRGAPGAPAAMLEFAGPIAAATAQRLACDASITRVVLSPSSAVLDVGRAHRLPSGPTRRALRARDGGCAWPNCDRPVSWTTAHHLVHWAEGGSTALENLVLLCHRHHRLVHEGGWQLIRKPDGTLATVAPIIDVGIGAPAPGGRCSLIDVARQRRRRGGGAGFGKPGARGGVACSTPRCRLRGVRIERGWWPPRRVLRGRSA